MSALASALSGATGLLHGPPIGQSAASQAIAAYRTSLRLLLGFAAERTGKSRAFSPTRLHGLSSASFLAIRSSPPRSLPL